MKLNKFVEALENIAKNTDKPDVTEVVMADYIPVAKPIFKDGMVFITDQVCIDCPTGKKIVDLRGEGRIGKD